MSETPEKQESAEDVVVRALANALHEMGAEAVIVLSSRNGEVTRRAYGDRALTERMAARYASMVVKNAVENQIGEQKEEAV